MSEKVNLAPNSPTESVAVVVGVAGSRRAVWAAYAALGGLWAFSLLDVGLDARTLRFAAVVTVATCAAAVVVLLGPGARSLGGARGWIRHASLPFFDDEFIGGAPGLRRRRPARWLMAFSVVWLSTPALMLAFGSAGVASQGELSAAVGDEAEAWHDRSRGVDRDFGFALRLDGIARSSDLGWVARLRAATADATFDRDVTLPGGGAVRFGDLSLRLVGVEATEAIGGARVSATSRSTGVRAVLDLRQGITADGPDGVRLTMVGAELNRDDGLGPAVRVRVDSIGEGGEVLADPVWLHAWAPTAHTVHGGGPVALELLELESGLIGHFAVSDSVRTPMLVPVLWALWFALGVAVMWASSREGAWLQGRSGDYELRVFRLWPFAGGSDDAHVAKLLPPKRLAEWRALVAQLERASRR